MNQGNDDISLADSSATDMPNRIGNVQILDPRKAYVGCPTNPNYLLDPTLPGSGCYFLPPVQPSNVNPNPDVCVPSTGAFVQNCALGTFGTANRRFFHGPGFNNTDFGILKRTVIHENYAFDLRFEFFNIFNHAQFKNPDGNIDNSTFGQITSARDPRIGQVSAKFYW
jgi:hypothetical protein